MEKQSSIFTIAALGDSMSTAYNAELPGDNPRLSWVTGDDASGRLLSHVKRLKRVLPPMEMNVVNLAFSGAMSESLPRQLGGLAGRVPDYVTIMIGANDMTRWLFGEYGSLLESYRQDLERTIESLLTLNSRVMILLNSIPDQSRVLGLLLRHGPLSGVGSALNPSVVAQLQRGYRERLDRVNHVLSEIATRFSGSVRLCTAISRVRFGTEHLSSIDSYHPSVSGQSLLAEVTWSEGFFL